jgi:hypothetical protein
LDQLSADRAQERVSDRRQAQRPKPAQPWQRAPEQRVVAEPVEELGVVVVQREHEAELRETRLVGSAELHDAVGLLPGSSDPTCGERRDERPAGEGPRRVADEPAGEPK